MASMQHYMQDSTEMFKVYQRIGGCSAIDKYKENLMLFFHHTLNSHCGGIGPELFNGASIDDHGFALHNGRAEAESAFVEAAKIDHAELCRIFESVDTVHAYS